MDSYGGQAVIEGVMMRGKKFMTTAVRLENGKIRIKKERLPQRTSFFSRAFFFRGMVRLYDMLRDGWKSLQWSAEQQVDEEVHPAFTIITTIIGVVVALALFKLIPFSVAKLLNPQNVFFFNLIDGVVKIIIFIIYLLIIGRMHDIKRTFQYHAAEHKTIACYEAKKKLTAKNCKPYKKEHKRCGTNFLFIVIVVGVIVYLFIPLAFSFWLNVLIRILLLPIIAGLAYEVLKLGAKWDNWFTTAIATPGLLLQKLTTFHPDEKQLEVGVASLKELLALEK